MKRDQKSRSGDILTALTRGEFLSLLISAHYRNHELQMYIFLHR